MPFAVPGFVQVHMLKTGGTWLRNALHATWPTEGLATDGGQHGPAVDLLPEDRAGRLVIGTIRDPWSWYVSLWIHISASEQRHDFGGWGGGSTAFRDVLYGWTHPATVEVLPKSLLCIWGPHSDRDEQEEALRSSSLYSWAVRYFYTDRCGGWLVDRLLDTAQLHAATGRLLGREITEARLPRLNTRQQMSAPIKPDDSAILYDKEAMRWVLDADGQMVNSTFRWRPFEASEVAIWRPTPTS